MRRSHKKSRYGCRECKQRHSKCDESRPACRNCTNANRHCSYLLPSRASPAASFSVIALDSPGTSASQTTTAVSTPSPNSVSSDIHAERYSLLHLELLHHFGSVLLNDLPLARGRGDSQALLTIIHEEAKSAPFLMDELLAISAAHRSTVAQDQRDRQAHLTEATKLQTRALNLYNQAPTAISEENCVAMFLFSAFLAQQVLFETFAVRSSLPALLDKLTQCLRLHRGIATVTGSSWPYLKSRLEPLFGHEVMEGAGSSEGVGSECAELLNLLSSSTDNQLDDSAREACITAVKTLQRMFDTRRNMEMAGYQCVNSAVSEWPVRVPIEYIQLVHQRRPEALLVLAHYAVLLHMARDYWAVGDVGAFIIRSVSDHLGDYWAAWLEWPNQCLDGVT